LLGKIVIFFVEAAPPATLLKPREVLPEREKEREKR